MQCLFFVFFALALPTTIVAQIPINIIVIIIGDNPSYGYSIQAPVYDVLFAKLQTEYPVLFGNIVQYVVYRPNATACADASVKMLTTTGELDTMIHRTEGLTILISPGCSLEIITLGDFAREWDVPLLTTSASDASLGNRLRYPSLVVFSAPDKRSIAEGFVKFFDYFNWHTVTLLCDALAFATFNFAAFTQPMCNDAGLAFKQSGRFLTYITKFDSTGVQAVNYTSMLIQVRKQCRVVVIITVPAVTRLILTAAYRLNMTNGDFVFVNLAPNKAPGIDDLFWQHSDEYDQIVLHAFRSVINIESPEPRWDKFDVFLKDVRIVSERKYNHTLLLSEQKQNTLTVAAYEGMTALTQMLNRTFRQFDSETTSGAHFASLFYNRSFDVDSRDVYIGSNGVRACDVIFKRFNNTSDSFEEAWSYRVISKSLLEASKNLANIWPNEYGPPVNKPLCGYSSELCSGQQGSNIVTTSTVACLITVVVMGGATTLVIR